MPKAAKIIELGVPSKKQEKNWFRTWEKRLPEPGNITFFDRSWYSRALIQPSMGYCSERCNFWCMFYTHMVIGDMFKIFGVMF